MRVDEIIWPILIPEPLPFTKLMRFHILRLRINPTQKHLDLIIIFRALVRTEIFFNMKFPMPISSFTSLRRVSSMVSPSSHRPPGIVHTEIFFHLSG